MADSDSPSHTRTCQVSSLPSSPRPLLTCETRLGSVWRIASRRAVSSRCSSDHTLSQCSCFRLSRFFRSLQFLICRFNFTISFLRLASLSPFSSFCFQSWISSCFRSKSSSWDMVNGTVLAPNIFFLFFRCRLHSPPVGASFFSFCPSSSSVTSVGHLPSAAASSLPSLSSLSAILLFFSLMWCCISSARLAGSLEPPSHAF